MPKRNLRILIEAAGTPTKGVCEYCNKQFTVPPHVLGQAKKGYVQEKFDEHKCARMDASQNAARIVKEATEDR